VPTQEPTSEASTTIILSAAIGRAGQKANDAVMIFVYVVASVTGIWCIYQLLKCCARTEKDFKRKQKLRTELRHIRLTMLDKAPRSSQQQLPENRPIGAFANGPNIDSGEVRATRSTRTRGAYVTGRSLIPASVGSDGSSSLVLSSLHSSEMSDISYSVYSTEFTKSSENVMEEGGDTGYAESNNCQGSSRSGGGGSNFDSEHSDGQSDNNNNSEDTMDQLSTESSVRSSEDNGSVNNESNSQGSVERRDNADYEDEDNANSVNSEHADDDGEGEELQSE